MLQAPILSPRPVSPGFGRTTIMPTGTVRLHRILRAQPEMIYRAFITADAIAKWIPAHGFTCTAHHVEVKVGGTFRISFTNFSSGNSNSFGGKYPELVPGEKLRYTDVFDDPYLPCEMQTMITLKPVLCGAEINVVQ